MPQAAIAWVASKVSLAVFASIPTTVSISTAATIANIAYFSTQALIYAGLTAAAGALARPNTPDPELAKSTVKQSRPIRRRGYGKARVGGAYMLFEAERNVSWDVLALIDRRIAGPWERFWLHDDEVFLNPDGPDFVVATRPDSRYSPNHVYMEFRYGLATETAYSDVVAAFPGLWTNDHRGDGIASAKLHANHGETKYLQEDFPNGIPLLSVSGKLAMVYDPRDGAQDPDDPDTWEWSDNPALILLDYLTTEMGLSYATAIAPAEGDWIAAANVCEEAVSLKAGGTEERYRCGGTYQADNAPADVIGTILSTFDGWLAQRGDGALTVKAGKYEAPTVTITGDHILDYSFRRFMPDEEAVNELLVSFTSPDHAYNTVETDPWTDDADIAARGRVRSDNLALTWVQSNGQARRLAKRRMSRLGAAMRGTIRTNLYGLTALGERYIRIQNPEITSMADLVVEVSRMELDLAGMSVTIDWIAADTNIDAWNPATEEGDGPTDVDRPAGEAAPVPEVLYVQRVAGSGGQQLRIAMTDIGRPDLTYVVRWRRTTEVSFYELSPQTATDEGAVLTVLSSLVPEDVALEVQVQALTGGDRRSDWSDLETVGVSGSLTVDDSGITADSTILTADAT
jgi:hypothetical protein